MNEGIENKKQGIDLGRIFDFEFHSNDSNKDVNKLQSDLIRVIEKTVFKRNMVTVSFEPEIVEYLITKWEAWNTALENDVLFFNGCYFMRQHRSKVYSNTELLEMGIDPYHIFDLYRLDNECFVQINDEDIDESDFNLCFAFKLRQLSHRELIDFLDQQSSSEWPIDFDKYLKVLSRDYHALIETAKRQTINEWIEAQPIENLAQRNHSKISVNQAIMVFYFLLEPMNIWSDLIDKKSRHLTNLIQQVQGGSERNIRKNIKNWSGESVQKEKDFKKVKELLEPLNNESINALLKKEMQE